MVAVCSGKGGVGKSTVSVNLALALRDQGLAMGLVDADLHGPDIPRMLNLTRRDDADGVDVWVNPRVASTRIDPIARLGISIVSAQFFMGEGQAFAAPTGFAAMFLNRLINDVRWSDTELLIVDLPPGTGDIQQRLVAMPGLLGVIVVVTPQDVAHLDARKLVGMLERRQVRVLGGVENMSGLDCPSCGVSIELFHRVPEDRSLWSSVDQLASVPFHSSITLGDQTGRPVVEAEPSSPPAEAFRQLATRVRELTDLKS
jgi:ATP-binding protein involved in chromosome partitioning